MGVVGVVIALTILGGAAAIDVWDWVNLRQRRCIDQIMKARHDELADIWSTQHSGSVTTPFGHLMKDRGVPGD